MRTRSPVLMLVFVVLTLITFATIPNTAFAHDAQTNIQNENDFYENLAQKNKQAIVAIRAEIDPAKVGKTDEQNNDSSKKLVPPFMPPIVPPVYQEMIFWEGLDIVQAFSTGTGFIITPDGEILTNYHVIDGYKEIEVKLYNGSIYKADVIGFDDKNDIALLKIKTEKPNFPTLTLGDSDTIYAPEKIMLIGHPLGFNYTVSLGTISGLNRPVYVHPLPLIQIQSSINPGNSGSPLITVPDNKVVGIVNAIVPNANQIGFAIPINAVKSLLPKLRSQQKATTGEGP